MATVNGKTTAGEGEASMSMACAQSVKRTPPIEESSERVAGWLASVPELETRRALLAYLREHKSLRRALFNYCNAIENIALIPDPRIAIEAVGLYWQHSRLRFEIYWKGRLSVDRGEEHRLWAELHGVLRNVYRNMLVKAGKLGQEFAEHDVKRSSR